MRRGTHAETALKPKSLRHMMDARWDLASVLAMGRLQHRQRQLVAFPLLNSIYSDQLLRELTPWSTGSRIAEAYFSWPVADGNGYFNPPQHLKSEWKQFISLARQVCPDQRNRMDADIFQRIVVGRQDDKLTRVYRDYDEDDIGEVSKAKKESLKLSKTDFIVGCGLIISDDEVRSGGRRCPASCLY
jgi:hypothetical protein